MPVLPIPYRCIWCRRTAAEVDFDESHVVPAFLGNSVQTLPPGIVCKPCNNGFGGKVERALLEDPMFDLYRWYAGARSARTGRRLASPRFGRPYPETSPPHDPLKFTVNAGRAGLNVRVESPVVEQFSHVYTDRQMHLLSRAYHKMAVEGLAWEIFMDDARDFSLDLFDPVFDPVRHWVRAGQPMAKVRPVLHGPYGTPRPGWDMLIYRHNDTLILGWDLLGDQLAVNLTSPSEHALPGLIAWAKDQWMRHGVDRLWGMGSFEGMEGVQGLKNTLFTLAL